MKTRLFCEKPYICDILTRVLAMYQCFLLFLFFYENRLSLTLPILTVSQQNTATNKYETENPDKKLSQLKNVLFMK